MADDGKIAHKFQRARVFHHLLRILNLVGHGHVLESPLAIAVTVEVEADAGDAVSLQRVGNEFEHRTVLRAAEAVTEHHHRTFLAILQLGRLYDGLQPSVIAVDKHFFAFA